MDRLPAVAVERGRGFLGVPSGCVLFMVVGTRTKSIRRDGRGFGRALGRVLKWCRRGLGQTWTGGEGDADSRVETRSGWADVEIWSLGRGWGRDTHWPSALGLG